MLENPVASFPDDLETPALSRRALLMMGAAAGVALTLPALPSRADTAPYSDVRALRFLEEIARMEADFFAKVANSTPAEGLQSRESSALSLIALQDAELARWFKAARGRYKLGAADTFFSPNQAISRPLPDYRFDLNAFASREGLYDAAIGLKETAVGAFHGVVGEADSPKMIQAFASLAGVQGRHLALLREMSGRDALVAFEPALSKSVAAEKLASYGFKREALA